MSPTASTALRQQVTADPPRQGPAAWLADFVRTHPVLFVFLLAIVVRAVLAIVLTLATGDTFFSDDATYSQLAAERAVGNTSRWDDYNYYLYDTTATFLVPLTGLYKLIGPEPLAGRLLVALFGSLAAAMTVRVALEALPRRWAVGAGAVVALLPSQVLFSSLVLKDSFVWAALAAMAVVAAVMGRSTGRALVGLLLAGGVLLGLLSHLRLHTLVVAAWAFALAALCGDREGRRVRIAGATTLLLVVPLWAGAGFAGATLVREQQGTLDQKRTANAEGAKTAFVPAPSHAPSVPPGGAAPEARSTDATTGSGDFDGAARGLRAIALDPLPWQSSANSRVAMARWESLFAWWPLLLMAAFGTVAALRDRAARRLHLRVFAFPLLAGGAIALMYGLSEGNFGTAYRHRGEFVWVVALLAAVGARAVAELVRKRRALEPTAAHTP